MMLQQLVLFVVPAVAAGVFQGNRPSGMPRDSIITAPTGVELVADENLPQQFDWRNVNNRSFVTADVNQHIPSYCGSCWIHGTVAALNDRLKVARGGAWPDVMLSRQTLLNCVPGPNDTAPPGCMGGDDVMVYEYMRHTKVPDETCNTYVAQNAKCDARNFCYNCDLPPGFLDALTSGQDLSKMHFDMSAGCKAMKGYFGYQVGDYGFINGTSSTVVQDMMKEIYARGPITCGLDGTGDFMNRYAEIAEQNEGVFISDQVKNFSDHFVEVTGWGVTPSGIEYWVVRNSWGTYWGEGGWFRIARGKNQNVIEASCSWAVPTGDDLDELLEGHVLGDWHRGVHPIARPIPGVAPPSTVMFTALHAAPSGQSFQTLIATAVGAAAAAAAATFAAMRSLQRSSAMEALLG